MVLRMACPTKRKASDNRYYRRTIPADVQKKFRQNFRPPCRWCKCHINISLHIADRAGVKATCVEACADPGQFAWA